MHQKMAHSRFAESSSNRRETVCAKLAVMSGPDQFHFDPTSYLDVVRCEVHSYDELQSQIARATVGIEAMRILDLGTGTGETARHVLAHHPEAVVIGLDESEGMLAFAREALAGADLRVGRLEDALPDGPFDLVVSGLAIHHLAASDKANLFHRIYGALRAGGRFVLGDLVVPADPEDQVTPFDAPYDKPSPLADQLRWLEAARLTTAVSWTDHDLVVIQADRAG
jgi:tRNA (cmo5U34)-methyltransferase